MKFKDQIIILNLLPSQNPNLSNQNYHLSIDPSGKIKP